MTAVVLLILVWLAVAFVAGLIVGAGIDLADRIEVQAPVVPDHVPSEWVA